MFLKKNSHIVIIIIVLVSRLPFIFNSLGLDSDIWREVFSGKTLAEKHIYNVSRFPGYPFSEFTFSIFYHFPYWVMNFISVIFTIGASIVFYEILKEKKIRNPLLISITFSFIPIIYINSTIAIDYNWSLFFIMCTVYSIVKSKFLLSAFLFGLITCSRLNNAMFILPFIFLVYSQSKNIKITLVFIFRATLFSILFFLPVIIRYQGKFLYHYGTEITSLKVYFSLGTLYLYGAIGSVVLALIIINNVLLNRKHILQSLTVIRKDFFYVFCIILITTNYLFFLKFPLEPGYLIPSIPFVVIILSKLIDEKSFKLLMYSFLISPFFLYVRANEFSLKGVLFVNEEEENKQLEKTYSKISQINQLPDNTIVYVSDLYEYLLLLKGKNGYPNKNIYKTLDKEKIIELKNKKIQIFYLEEALNDNDKLTPYLNQYGKSINK